MINDGEISSWVSTLIVCVVENWIIFLSIVLVVSLLIYRMKCEKNIYEMALESIRTGNTKQIAGILIFILMMMISTMDNFWLQLCGIIGSVILILGYMLAGFDLDKIKDNDETAEEQAKKNLKQSVLGDQ